MFALETANDEMLNTMRSTNIPDIFIVVAIRFTIFIRQHLKLESFWMKKKILEASLLL